MTLLPRGWLTGATCPFLMCLVSEAHQHPICPECGSYRCGNLFCATCRAQRDTDPNPVILARDRDMPQMQEEERA